MIWHSVISEKTFISGVVVDFRMVFEGTRFYKHVGSGRMNVTLCEFGKCDCK